MKVPLNFFVQRIQASEIRTILKSCVSVMRDLLWQGQIQPKKGVKLEPEDMLFNPPFFFDNIGDVAATAKAICSATALSLRGRYFHSEFSSSSKQ